MNPSQLYMTGDTLRRPWFAFHTAPDPICSCLGMQHCDHLRDTLALMHNMSTALRSSMLAQNPQIYRNKARKEPVPLVSVEELLSGKFLYPLVQTTHTQTQTDLSPGSCKRQNLLLTKGPQILRVFTSIPLARPVSAA